MQVQRSGFRYISPWTNAFMQSTKVHCGLITHAVAISAGGLTGRAIHDFLPLDIGIYSQHVFDDTLQQAVKHK